AFSAVAERLQLPQLLLGSVAVNTSEPAEVVVVEVNDRVAFPAGSRRTRGRCRRDVLDHSHQAFPRRHGFTRSAILSTGRGKLRLLSGRLDQKAGLLGLRTAPRAPAHERAGPAGSVVANRAATSDATDSDDSAAVVLRKWNALACDDQALVRFGDERM